MSLVVSSHIDFRRLIDRLRELVVVEAAVELHRRQHCRVNAEANVQDEGVGSVVAAVDAVSCIAEAENQDADLECPGKDADVVFVDLAIGRLLFARPFHIVGERLFDRSGATEKSELVNVDAFEGPDKKVEGGLGSMQRALHEHAHGREEGLHLITGLML